MFSAGLGDFETNHCLSVTIKSTLSSLPALTLASQDNIEVVKAENGILRRKLQSKTEGLMIISKEVELLKNELNQMKSLNEHLMNPVLLTFQCISVKYFRSSLERIRPSR